jgi:hypothetical protein
MKLRLQLYPPELEQEELASISMNDRTSKTAKSFQMGEYKPKIIGHLQLQRRRRLTRKGAARQ